MRRLFSWLLTLTAIAAIALGGALWMGKQRFEAPGPAEQEIVVDLPRGTGLSGIAARLVAAGAISDPTIFRLGARAMKAERALKAGEYAIPPRASMAEILEMLRDGQVLQRKLTFAEGLTSHEIVERVRAADGLTGEIDTVPAEGSLAPDTYLYLRGETRAAVLARMEAAQRAILDELWPSRADDLPIDSPEEALILASIVEKETGLASERRKVAGVFVNRLRRGMRLQSDPTVIYGITLGKGELGRGLRRSELDARTPFNTYAISGLPPTPIANPGRESIAAVLDPEPTDALYFVADGTGGHAFARTLKEHNRNVANWRRIERERQSE